MKMTLAGFAVLGTCACAASAITDMEFDDFESGSTLNWAHGTPSPIPPTVETEGSNSFLRIESLGGGGPGSRLAAFNRAQWTGDYVSAGVRAISMDVRNSGDTDLVIRFGVRNSENFTSATNDAIMLTAGSGWQTATLDLTDLAFGVSFQEYFSNVIELRIVSAVNPDFLGDPIAATLDVDNIRAVVPAPGGVALLGLAGALHTRRRR